MEVCGAAAPERAAGGRRRRGRGEPRGWAPCCAAAVAEGTGSGRTLSTLWGSKTPGHPPWVLPQRLSKALRDQQTSATLCVLHPLAVAVFFSLLPPHCLVNMRILLQYNIKHSLCKSIPLKRRDGNIHQRFCSINLSPIYNYPLWACVKH